MVPGPVVVPGPNSSRWRAAAAALKSPLSGVRPKPPILASDVLKDEVAPLHPWSRAARWACGAAALALAALALGARRAVLAGVRPPGLPLTEVVFALAFAAAAGLRLPYQVRAGAMVGLGFGLLVEGAVVPLGALHRVFSAPLEGPGGVAARTVAATCLAAALFFRAHYRAYRGARALLALAWLIALPFVAHAVSLTELGPPLVRLSSAASLLAVAASLIGFMGAGTTALASAWALAVLAILPIDLALRPLAMGQPWGLSWLAGVASWALACGLAALGLFQVLAALLARRAREVDVM
ncbi:MAG TPA: hypothetical protein VFS00_15510, partial [Polyangiaceae bacterium]|nr:hypothetical protein [Polyangiaceae bacterium]